MTAIYKRELRSFFSTPLGYVFSAVYLAVSGFLFSLLTIRAGTADVSSFSRMMVFALVILLPILTMRSFSEERKQKTDQLLFTSPVTVTGAVFGKFLAAMTVFTGNMLLSSVYLLPLKKYLNQYSKINGAKTFGCYLAVFLIGTCFIAVGIFISSLTENQVTACVGTIAALMFFSFTTILNGVIDKVWIRTVLSWVSVLSRFSNFSYGIFDFSALVYYISFAGVFLFLAIRVTDSRRWR